MVPDDIIVIIVKAQTATNILSSRLLNTDWKRIIDNFSMEDWRTLYHQRVGLITDVSPIFNWKHALIHSEQKQSEIEAYCTWKSQNLRIVAPWVYTEDCVCIQNALIIGCNLHSGIVRCYKTVALSQGVCVDFVYDNAFKLRGIRQTCVKRGDVPCINCVQRKRCSNQKYRYYLYKLDNPMVNDILCMRVRGVV